MTRPQAHAEIQNILGRSPHLAAVAAAWQRGAKDDTVYAKRFIWFIYRHPDDEDPRKAALVWLEGLASTTMRTSGANVEVAAFPHEHD